jgi:peptide/nickel transport system substrate-binding protein
MRFPRRITLAMLLTLGLAVLGLSACGNGEEKAHEEGTAAAAAGIARPDTLPRPAGALIKENASGVYGGRYVATVRSDPKTWNALAANETSTTDITNLLFEGLVSFNNKTQETEPALAASWDRSQDGLSWTFHLRRGVRWSDGAPITADDVLFSSRILYDQKIHPAAQELCMAGGKPFRFTKVDSYTVQVTLPEPYGPFLSVIGAFPVMPRHKLEAAYEAGTYESAYGVDSDPDSVATSGPWRLSELVPQQKVVLKPNPYFFEYDPAGHRLPYLDELVFLVVPDQNAEVLKFRGGESDEIYFRAEDYAHMKDGEKAGNYTVYDLGMEMGTNMIWFNLNTGKNPKTGRPYVDPVKEAWFQNLDFRRAVAHAVNRKSIAETVYYGTADPLYGPIPPVNKKWYNPNIEKYTYDLDEARRLLDEAGMKDRDGDGVREDAQGHPISFVILTNTDSRERVATGNILVADLAKIGIKATMAPSEFNTVITKLADSYDYDAILLGLTGGVPPDPIMSSNVFKSSGKTHFWYPKQKHPHTAWEAEVDSLMNAQVTMMDPVARKAVFDKVQLIISQEVPMIYTVSRRGFIAVRNNFTGLEPTVLRPWVLWQSETVSYNPAEAHRELAQRAEN